MIQQDVWAFPEASDPSPRRLINCANLIKSLGNDADELRRYVCARDLHEKPRRIPLFEYLTEAQTKSVNDLLKRLFSSQKQTFQHVYDSKHDIVFI